MAVTVTAQLLSHLDGAHQARLLADVEGASS